MVNMGIDLLSVKPPAKTNVVDSHPVTLGGTCILSLQVVTAQFM